MEPHPEGEKYVAEEGAYATSSSTIPVLHYYPARGRGEVIRLCLSYVKQPWFEPAEADVPAIEAIKRQELDGYPFRQLPRFIDEVNGPVDLVQSMAILRHLGRKYALYGSDLLEAAAVDMICDGCQDLRAALKLVYYGDEAANQQYVETVLASEEQLVKLSGFKGPGMACLERLAGLHPGPWMLGRSFSIADIVVFDLVDMHQGVFADAMKKFPHLMDHYKAVAEQQGIADYLQSKNRHSLVFGDDWVKKHKAAAS